MLLYVWVAATQIRIKKKYTQITNTKEQYNKDNLMVIGSIKSDQRGNKNISIFFVMFLTIRNVK